MKQIFTGLLCLSLVGLPASTLAKEPTNLAVTKRAVVYYHDSGEYDKDITKVSDQALQYLHQRIKNADYGKKPAVVLDVDETSLSNYPNLVNADFGGTMEAKVNDRKKANGIAIMPVLKIYQFAKSNHFAIFFITGRIASEKKATIVNLQKAGYRHWDGLIIRSDAFEKTPASIYKTAMRKRLAEQGYDILLNIGDQYSDLRGGYADKTFKLPNPFYLIP